MHNYCFYNTERNRPQDDTIEGGKRAVNRKWKELSVVLTATQLLFFRDLNFALQLRDLAPGGEFHDPNIQASLLNPDEVVSLYEAIAVMDTTYTKVRSELLSCRGTVSKYE
jgi:hypothetical protein